MQTDNINVLRDLKVRSSPQSALATSKLLQLRLRYFCITDRLKARQPLIPPFTFIEIKIIAGHNMLLFYLGPFYFGLILSGTR